MARRVTSKMLRASRRNIVRAQMSRKGIREPRSVGRAARSREYFSRPSMAARPRTR